MTLYFDGEYKEQDADFEPCIPVRKGKDVEGISIRELKGGRCVSLIHKGPYERLRDSYKKVFGYINEKGYRTKVPTREVYRKGPGLIFKGNPNNYLTEIQVLIEE
jgi:effector-binding domain-containing protein